MAAAKIALAPKITPAADVADVLRDQLESLISHAQGDRVCGCPDCVRYLRVRMELMEPFAEPGMVDMRKILWKR